MSLLSSVDTTILEVFPMNQLCHDETIQMLCDRGRWQNLLHLSQHLFLEMMNYETNYDSAYRRKNCHCEHKWAFVLYNPSALDPLLDSDRGIVVRAPPMTVELHQNSCLPSLFYLGSLAGVASIAMQKSQDFFAMRAAGVCGAHWFNNSATMTKVMDRQVWRITFFISRK